MTNLIDFINLCNLLEKIADTKGVNYLTNLLEKNGFNPDLYFYPQSIESEYVQELTNLLEESLEELPF